MKKIIPYTLIFFIFVGFFGIATPVNAGPCTGPGADGTGVEVIGGTTIIGRCSGICTQPNSTPENPIWAIRTNDECLGGPGKWNWDQNNNTAIKRPTILKTGASQVNTDTTYTPLAPLPLLGAEGCKDAKGVILKGTDGKPVPCIDTTTECAFGKYLDVMIKIFIGIAAVLAVVMIVIGGMEYMTSELISSKEHGKERIRNAILGLLIALGSYALLNTINPELLNKCLDKLPQATIVISGDEGGPALTTYRNIPVPPGAIAKCTSGIVSVATKGGFFQLCLSVYLPFQTMINQAWNEGYKISGGGFRTAQEQIQLRKNNCPDTYNSPSSSCNPPTAKPGESMHESGLAFDLTCDGVQIQARDNKCFVWLNKIARSYGFYNFGDEPWHWSTNGK